jgi:hypothetical protein
MLYDKFVATTSTHEINIASTHHKKLQELRESGELQIDSFFEAKWEVYRVMEVDSFQRFKSSNICKLFFEAIAQYTDETEKYDAMSLCPIMSESLMKSPIGIVFCLSLAISVLFLCS